MTPSHTIRRAAARGAIAALAATTLLAACGDDEDDASSSDTTEAASETTAPETTEAPAGEITVDGAWGRTSPMVATAGAVYMEITNDTGEDDALVGASVDPSVAATVELHETAAAGEGDEGGMTATTMGTEMSTSTMMGTDTTGAMGTDTTMPGTGMMEMRPVEAIELPAGETAVLEPGGYHIMLIDLAEPLAVGTTIDVTLTFEYAGEQVVTVEIRDTAP